MREEPNVTSLAAKVAARIREFRVARGLSIEQLAEAARLSSNEVRVLQEGREEITTDLVERIADVFDVHPAALLMCPDDDPMAQLLEPHRDASRTEFQRIAGELVARGYRRSRGSA